MPTRARFRAADQFSETSLIGFEWIGRSPWTVVTVAVVTKKRKVTGTCIYCGNLGEVTDEHVFPVAWYPDDTPPGLWKWQVPACLPCNRDHYGKIEDRLFPYLAASVEPQTVGGKGIAERAFRGVDHREGRNERDAAARRRAFQRMMQTWSITSDVPDDALLPQWRSPDGQYLTTHVDALDMIRLIGKIVRGITYIQSGKRIDDNYRVVAFREKEKVPPQFFGQPLTVLDRGPGIVIGRISIDEPISFHDLLIWRTHRFFGAVIPKNMDEYRRKIEELRAALDEQPQMT